MGTIRQQITIDASPRQVWKALTSEEDIRVWWSAEARVDARDGGRIVLGRGEGDTRIDERGVFHKVQPTRDIEITWEVGTTGPSRGTRLEFLVGRGDGETKVHVVAHGAGLDDPEAKATLDAFWKEALKRLRAVFEGKA